jgi:hypothetical protein
VGQAVSPAFALMLLLSSMATAAPRVDNVLIRMVPAAPTALVGVHMQELEASDTFHRLLPSQALAGIDEFAAETGFDPRRDVKELLFATTGQGEVLLARGRFQVNPAATRQATKIRHGDYTIWARGSSGFCVLDGTLAAAGEITAVEAALDEWRHGNHTAARALVAQAAPVDPASQVWGVASGEGTFLAEHLPRGGTGLDFSKVLRELSNTWFEADLATRFHLEAHGTATTEKDALNLRDAIRGMVGLGRLNVPEDESDMLPVFDGIGAEQQGRSITVKVDIAKNLVGKLMDILTTAPRRLGRGLL